MQTRTQIVVGTLLACASSLPAQNVWQLTAPSGSGPTSGVSAGLVYAPSVSSCYLFGGTTGAASSDETWQYDGLNATWTQLSTINSPPPRHSHAMCYDTNRDVIVVFGGQTQGSNIALGDTWEYSPATNTWTNVTPVGGLTPNPRWGAAMAFDILRGVAVLYCGWGGSGMGYQNDTWEWDGASWNQIPTNNQPNPRDRYGLCYDLGRARCVMFGGTTALSNETWEYDGVDWTLVPTLASPGGRQDVSLAYDAGRGVCVVHGGRAGSTQRTDSWEYHGTLGTWRQIPTLVDPGRNEMTSAYDLQRGYVVLFGGRRGGMRTDTWEYGAATAPSFATFGVGCPGSNGTPDLTAGSGTTPALGTTLDLEMNNLNTTPGAGFLMLGFSDFQVGPTFLPLDLSILGWSGCTGYVSPDTGLFFVHTTTTATVPIPIPANPALQLVTFYAQSLLLDGGAPNGAVASTQAAEIVVY